jgi:hypothetical protein
MDMETRYLLREASLFALAAGRLPFEEASSGPPARQLGARNGLNSSDLAGRG